MVRFRHGEFLTPAAVGVEVPELAMTNAHDGTSVVNVRPIPLPVRRAAWMGSIVVPDAGVER
jgi:hypothetical protein